MEPNTEQESTSGVESTTQKVTTTERQSYTKKVPTTSFKSSTTREPPSTCDGMPGIMLRVAFAENADMIAGNEEYFKY